MSYRLGIDTGGTYTDAVIIDAECNVLAKNKSLTSGYDLAVGIDSALANLPDELLAAIDLVALSTTLSTNSVVEGRGSPVSIFLPGYNQKQVEASGLYQILDRDLINVIDGGHSAVGAELMVLDKDRAAEKILAQSDKVSAFAVSSIFSVRNPRHEVELKKLIGDLTDRPVACGHELAVNLGAQRRAVTAAINARMIVYIQLLIDSVERILKQRNIKAPLMIVKGDGSLVNIQTALKQPVMTVLSGPAASVTGACTLSGQHNAIAVDMGGTTTDISIVTDGKPDLCADGARIGNWHPMVEAIRVFSIGLGGDSEVDFKGKIILSHRRVVPMSLLAYQYPEVLPKLERQLRAAPNARNNRFALRLQKNETLFKQLTETERHAWNALEAGPIELDSLVDSNRQMLRGLASMERMGLVIYSGFTPSDATHVLGMSDHWELRAAQLGVKIWARKMRHLYGCGSWRTDDIVEPCQLVFELVTHAISQRLIEAGLNRHGILSDSKSRNLTQLLADITLGDLGDINPLFDIKFATNYPVVAVGGAAHDYFPAVAKKLGIELHLPPHAEIANAVGAALGMVVQTAHVTVMQPEFGVFYLFHKQEPERFEQLDIALEAARALAVREATRLAHDAGADAIQTIIRQDNNHIKHDIDGELFVSTTITAIASGKPRHFLRVAGSDMPAGRC